MALMTRFSNGTSKASIRAVLALIFAAGLTIGAVANLFTNVKDGKALDWKEYKEIGMIAIMWYYAKKQDEDVPDIKQKPEIPQGIHDIPPEERIIGKVDVHK